MSRAPLALILVYTGYVGLFGLLMLWLGWLAPPQVLPKSLALLLLVGPLLLPLRGVLQGRPRSFTGLLYLALLYFLHGCGEFAALPEERLLAGLEILFACTLYLGCLLHLRARKMAAKGAPHE